MYGERKSQELRDRVARGEYTVDPEAVAEAVLSKVRRRVLGLGSNSLRCPPPSVEAPQSMGPSGGFRIDRLSGSSATWEPPGS